MLSFMKSLKTLKTKQGKKKTKQGIAYEYKAKIW